MKQELEQAIAAAVQALFDTEIDVVLTRPEAQFGDFSTNAALQLSRPLGKNPREIAETLKTALLERLSEQVREITIAGPGFLNLWLTDKTLFGMVKAQPAALYAGQKIIVEYSDPNPFKPLHAGHLYTTLVGDTIARLIEATGAETIRINYGGDVGLHVGKSMWAIVQALGGEYPDKLAEIPEDTRPVWLGARYVEGNNAYEDDETAKAAIKAANKRVYELQAADDHASPFAQIYWICREWSYEYFKRLYRELDVHPFDRFLPESEVTPLGLETVLAGLESGVFTRSNGAVIFEGEKEGLHTRVFINQEGLPTYETKDVGLSLTKWRDYHFDHSIIITAHEQAPYMQVVIAALKQLAPEPAERTRHLTHGVVKLQGGVKMSSRKGNIVSALDILEAAREAGAETGTNPSEETILAAVKYAFAKNRIGGDIEYDPRESVALEGNSGPYLQYAHARACSILSKAGSRPTLDGANDVQPDERTLLSKIGEFSEVVERAAVELLPHHVCTYLYELAQTFNRFYEHNRVIGDEREVLRLGLVGAYADTLKQGLQLLGIAAPDKL